MKIAQIFPVSSFEREPEGAFSATGIGLRWLQLRSFPGQLTLPVMLGVRAEPEEDGTTCDLLITVAGPDLSEVGRHPDTVTITTGPRDQRGSTLYALNGFQVQFDVPSPGYYTFNVNVDGDEQSFTLEIE